MTRPQRPGHRIALVLPEGLPFPPVRGGAVQTYALELVRRLGEPANAPFDFTAIAPADREAEKAGEAMATRLETIEAESGAEYLAGAARILREGSFDLVHVWNRPEFVATCKKAVPGRRVILNLHNDHLNRGVDRKTARACVETVDRVVTNGEYLRRVTAKGFPELAGRTTCVRSGVDLSLFRPATGEEERVALRESMGIPPRARVVLYAGRLRSTKGVHILLRAMRRIVREFPDAVLVVAGASWFGDDTGDTPYVRKLRSLAARLGPERVRFTGFVPYGRMPGVFRAAELFAAPALWNDPFPRSNLEALASGVPVVSTRRGGIPELVLHEVTGCLVPFPRLAISHARAIAGLLRDPRRAAELGMAGRRLAERDYDWDRTAAQIADEYRALL